MSLQAFQYRTRIIGLACLIFSNHSFASPDLLHRAEVVDDGKSMDKDYNRIIKRDKKSRSPDRVFEDTVSGIAAVMIGMYGYYFDNRGLLVKVIYSATQTAGVYLISDATFRANQPNLVLDLDSRWKSGGEFSYDEFRSMVVRNDDDLKIADHKKNAYAGALLATIYFYTASKEKEIKALSNVFYFLGFNFVLVSGASFYKIFTYERTQLAEKKMGRNPAPVLEAVVLPLPRVTLTF